MEESHTSPYTAEGFGKERVVRKTDFIFRISHGGPARLLTYDEAVVVVFGKPTVTLACANCKKAFAIAHVSGCLDDAGQVVAVACTRCKGWTHGRWVSLMWYVREKLALFQHGLALEENTQRDEAEFRSQLRCGEPPTASELEHLAAGFGSAVRTKDRQRERVKSARRGRKSRQEEETVHDELAHVLAGAQATANT